jgi:peptidoglycan hydrolase FlgJ
MDVARAAEPARRQQAVARLGETDLSAAFPSALALAAAETTPAKPGAAAAPAGLAAKDRDAARSAETYRHFEAMALANMLESSMTTSSASFFGKGVAGDTWKSFLVDQIAEQMAKAGGIGIAAQLAKSAGVAHGSGGTGSGPAVHSLLVSNLDGVQLRGLEPDKTGDDSPG